MTNLNITFRPYNESDLSFILAVYASSREAEMEMVSWSDGEKKAFLDMQCQAQLYHYDNNYLNAEHHIILIDGKAAGRLYVSRSDRELRLMDITLLTTYRNHGAGMQIMSDLIRECDQTDRTLTLHVEIINPGALRFYQRLGFEAVTQNGAHLFMQRLPKMTENTPKEGIWPSHSSQKSD